MLTIENFETSVFCFWERILLKISLVKVGLDHFPVRCCNFHFGLIHTCNYAKSFDNRSGYFIKIAYLFQIPSFILYYKLFSERNLLCIVSIHPYNDEHYDLKFKINRGNFFLPFVLSMRASGWVEMPLTREWLIFVTVFQGKCRQELSTFENSSTRLDHFLNQLIDCHNASIYWNCSVCHTSDKRLSSERWSST